MKKATIILASLVIGGMTFMQAPALASAEESIVPISIETEDTSTNYMEFSGVIASVEPFDNGKLLIVKNEAEQSEMHFILNGESLLFQSSNGDKIMEADLKEGVSITGFYDKYAPMTMIFPPRTAPSIIVLNEEGSNVKLGFFGKDFVSLDNQLQLNIDKNTIIQDENGQTVEDIQSIAGDEWLVFYGPTTKSIPAQTAPDKIIAIPLTENQKIAIAHEAIGNDEYEKNGVRMIPIRKLADALGNDITWDQKSETLQVKKMNRTFTIKIGDKNYGLNRSNVQFKVAPELKNNRTYVSEDFLQVFIENN